MPEIDQDSQSAQTLGFKYKHFSITLEELDLNIRVHFQIRRHELLTAGSILVLPYSNILKISQFGKKSMKELLDRLQNRGFHQDGFQGVDWEDLSYTKLRLDRYLRDPMDEIPTRKEELRVIDLLPKLPIL